MTKYYNHSVNLSIGQKNSLAKAYKNNEGIKIRLAHNQLQGSDEMMLTKTQINRIKKSIATKKGMDLTISKAQIRKSIKYGGNLFSTILSMGTKLLPMASKLLKTVGPGLATGALSSLGNFSMDKVLGRGQIGGFLIPQNKIDQLVKYKDLLTKSQREQILKSIQNNDQVIVKPTKTQQGGFLGSLLATIGVPLLISALSGKGLQVDRQPIRNTKVYVPQGGSQPFIGSWDPIMGMGIKAKKKTKKKTPKKTPKKAPKNTKKKTKKKQKATGLILGPSSPFKNIPVLGTIF